MTDTPKSPLDHERETQARQHQEYRQWLSKLTQAVAGWVLFIGLTIALAWDLLVRGLRFLGWKS